MNNIKTHIKLALFALCIILFGSCGFETSDNGDLDGFWHLTRIDTLSNSKTYDLSNDLRFWAVEAYLLQVSDKEKGTQYVFHFEKSNSTLRVYDPHIQNRYTGDPEIEDSTLLSPFGINSLDETFAIEKLNSSKMTLCGDSLRLNFVKM